MDIFIDLPRGPARRAFRRARTWLDRMSIHINLAVVMHEWSRRHGLAGPSLTLGVQDVSFTRTEYDGALVPPDAGARATDPSTQPHSQLMTPVELFSDLRLG